MSFPVPAILSPTHAKIYCLQRHSVGQLNQVKAAFLSSPDAFKPKAIVTQSIEGQTVFSSYALIPSSWLGCVH